MALTKVIMLKSDDGRLWASEDQYENAIIQEELESKLKPLANRFLELCKMVAECKNVDEKAKNARAFVVFLRQNKDVLRAFME